MVRQIAHPGAVSPPVSPAGRGKTEPEPKPEPEPENSSNVQEGRAEPAGSPEERPTSAMSARELVKWAEQLSSRSPTGRLASALKEAAESPPKEYGNTEERLEALALKTVAAVSQGAGAVHRQLEHKLVQAPATKLTLKPAKLAADLPKTEVPKREVEKPDMQTSDKPRTDTPSVSDSQSLRQLPATETLSAHAAGKKVKRSSKPKPANKHATSAIDPEVLCVPNAATPISRKLTRPDPDLGLSNLDKDGKTVKPCRFGLQCTREGCWFAHPEGYQPPPPGSDDLRGAQRRAELLKKKQQQEEEQQSEQGAEAKEDVKHEHRRTGSMESAQQRKDRTQKAPKRKVKQQRTGKGNRDADGDGAKFVVNLPSGKQLSVGRAAMDAHRASNVPSDSSSTERGTGMVKGKGKGKGSKSDVRQPTAKATRQILEHFICDWINSRGGEVDLDELVDTLGSTKAGGTTYSASAKYWTKQPTVVKAVLAIVETSTLFEVDDNKDSRGNEKRCNTKKQYQNEKQGQSQRRENKHQTRSGTKESTQHREGGGRQYR